MEQGTTPARHPSPTKQSSQALPGPPSPSPRPPEDLDMHSNHEDDEQNDQTVIKMIVDAPAPKMEPPPKRNATRTPEQQQPQPTTPKRNGHKEGQAAQDMSSPGHIAAFDWDEFEVRYHESLERSNQEQEQLLKEFDQLVKYFNIWASSASAHDSERAVKRLQTRERFVRIHEQSLDQKKQHLKEVVQAFKSALALLNRA